MPKAVAAAQAQLACAEEAAAIAQAECVSSCTAAKAALQAAKAARLAAAEATCLAKAADVLARSQDEEVSAAVRVLGALEDRLAAASTAAMAAAAEKTARKKAEEVAVSQAIEATAKAAVAAERTKPAPNGLMKGFLSALPRRKATPIPPRSVVPAPVRPEPELELEPTPTLAPSLPSTPLWQPGSFAERQSVWLIEAARLAAGGEAAFRRVPIADWCDHSRHRPGRMRAGCPLSVVGGCSSATCRRRPSLRRHAPRFVRRLAAPS